MRYSDGEIYEGEFSNDMRDGKGVYKQNNQKKYEGEWQTGL